MKLIIKITLLYVLISSVVFLIGGMITYRAMSREIELEEKWFLEERLQSVMNFLKRRQPKKKLVRDKMIITPLETSLEGLAPETAPVFSDTLVMHAALQRIEPHLKLDVIRHADGKAYQITLYDLIIEEDDIEDAVQVSMFKTFLLLFAVSLILSFISSYYVFKPFQSTLREIRNFSIKEKKPVSLPASSTSEFKKLNQFVFEMTNKVRSDYQALKEFSENASHEMQTPLSIAQGKLELLMGAENLSEEQVELINSAQQAISRLSKMGNSLFLLTKIDNREFSETESVNLSEALNRFLFDFKELIDLKSITLESEIEENVRVQGNKILLELLITNLLNNAIRHNKEDGEIMVTLDSSRLVVANTGNPLKFPPEDYFKRFKKDIDQPGSSGLGLSIVKRICEEHHFDISYRFENEQHLLTVYLTAK